MNNLRLVSQIDSLDALLERTEDATGGNIGLMGHWGQYLCVLTAGFLENALQEVYGDYARTMASPQVARFATASLERITNPKGGPLRRHREKLRRRMG